MRIRARRNGTRSPSMLVISRHQLNAKTKIGPLQLHLSGSAQAAKQSADGTLTQPEPSTSVASAAEVETDE